MGKPQGDNLPEPTYYQRQNEVTGELEQRPAFVAADHVNLQARGWVVQDRQVAQERPAAGEAQAGAKPAGSQRREAARVVPAQQAAAPADGGSNA